MRISRALWHVLPLLATVVIFVVIFRRVPYERLLQALAEADAATFLALMISNTVFYFCWDTLVLAVAIRWFHGPVRYRDLLPVRAASYVVAVFNTNLARGALAAYLARSLGGPLLPLGSTVIFLVLSEYLHLVGWAAGGMLIGRDRVPQDLLWMPPLVAASWLALFAYMRLGLTPVNLARALYGRPPLPGDRGIRGWSVLRTLREAPLRRYLQIIALRSPMFAVSLVLHYFAVRAFGLEIPFLRLLAFLPIIFMIAALPISVARLGTTQAAWLFFFAGVAPEPRLLAFSLAAHASFAVTRALLGVAFTPRVWRDLVKPRRPEAVGAP
jgi:hypothetical protein